MLAFRNLLRRKVRTLFALLGIAIGISAVVSIVSMARGLRTQFYRIADQFAYDIIVVRKGTASPVLSSVSARDRDRILKVDGVRGASLFAFHFLRLADISRPQPIPTLGFEPGGEILKRYEIVRGRGLKPDDEAALLLGELAARQLRIDVGGELVCEDGSYKVVGVFRPPVSGVDLLAGQAIVNLAYLERHFERTPNIVVAHLRLGGDAFEAPGDPRVREAQIAPVISAIATTKGMKHLEAKAFRDYLDSFRQVEIVDKFAWAISFLAALIGGIGIANTMLMSVFERTREIGLLRAVGWSRRRVAAMIVTEGLTLSVVGGALGIPFGVLEIALATRVIEMGWVQVDLEPKLYAQAVLLAALIGVLGSLYPSLRAANLEPTEALRYE